MKRLFSNSRKGQSAIEYLMTYGWMLLVVAIVGGAVITTVQDSQSACEQQIHDLDTMERSFGISDFTVTSDQLNIQLENNDQQTATVNYVNITNQQGEVVEDIDAEQMTLGFGDSDTVETGAISIDEDACSTFNVVIDYERGDLPDELSGALEGQMSEA